MDKHSPLPENELNIYSISISKSVEVTSSKPYKLEITVQIPDPLFKQRVSNVAEDEKYYVKIIELDDIFNRLLSKYLEVGRLQVSLDSGYSDMPIVNCIEPNALIYYFEDEKTQKEAETKIDIVVKSFIINQHKIYQNLLQNN
ncbi:hypothetical protein [Paenibacillus taichungensis]|uniref:hypothetical protein n=1 Tax=Paenibacillus taichungensis TaxID=484184 RepID=UPI0035E19FDB